MASKSLDNQIQNYLPLLGIEEKKSILSVIKSFLKSHEASEHFKIEQYNKELEEAEKRIDNGDYYTQEEVENKARKW